MSATPPRGTPRPLPQRSEIHRELRRKGVMLTLLWHEYKAAHPQGVAVPGVCVEAPRGDAPGAPYGREDVRGLRWTHGEDLESEARLRTACAKPISAREPGRSRFTGRMPVCNPPVRHTRPPRLRHRAGDAPVCGSEEAGRGKLQNAAGACLPVTTVPVAGSGRSRLPRHVARCGNPVVTGGAKPCAARGAKHFVACRAHDGARRVVRCVALT